MSRSRKVCSFHGITRTESEKRDKQLWHRAYRRICKHLIRKGIEDMPHFREHSDRWNMDKGGKRWFDARQHPKWMRK